MSTVIKAKPQAKTIIIEENSAHDLIILGGGPAGLTAAIYALRARINTLMIEKMMLGGQASTTYKVDNYPGFETISGMDLTAKMSEQAKELGLETIFGNVASLKKVGKLFELNIEGRTFTSRAVIIATGTEATKLEIPGEEEYRGKGVSYCATCDGPFYRNKNVVVVGGGNSAIEESLFLTRFASKVSIVHRRDTLRADKIIVEQAKSHPKIYFFWHSGVEEIKGDGKSVNQVIIKDLNSGKKINLPAEGIFIYVGNRPSSELVKELVKTDSQGFILTDERMRTAEPGLFAAGDVRAKSLRQIITAAADGAIAAEAAREFIEKGL